MTKEDDEWSVCFANQRLGCREICHERGNQPVENSYAK